MSEFTYRCDDLERVLDQIEHDVSTLATVDCHALREWLATFLGDGLERTDDAPRTLEEAGQRSDGAARLFEAREIFLQTAASIVGPRPAMKIVHLFVEAVSAWTNEVQLSAESDEAIRHAVAKRLCEQRSAANTRTEEILASASSLWERTRYEAFFTLCVGHGPLSPFEEVASLIDDAGNVLGTVTLTRAPHGSFADATFDDPRLLTNVSYDENPSGTSHTYLARSSGPFTIEITTQDTWNTPARPYSTLIAQPIRF